MELKLRINDPKTSQSGVKTEKGNLILDNHKLSYHYDRFEKWLEGELVAPVSVDMALTRSCGAMCSFATPWCKNLTKELL